MADGLEQLKTDIGALITKVNDMTPSADEVTPENATDLLGDSYVQCIEAMAQAAVLAFNHVAGELQVTGFQASVAALQAFGRMQHVEGPFMIARLEKALFPQYSITASVDEWATSDDSLAWLREQARNKISENEHRSSDIAPAVWAHWQMLAAAPETAPVDGEDG